MTANPVIAHSVSVADPDAPENCIKPNADGSVNVVGANITVGNVTVTSGNITTTEAVASSFITGQVVVGNTSTAIFGSGNQTTFREVYNPGNVSVWIGNGTVTTSTGHEVPAGAAFDMPNNSGALSGVVASGNVTISKIGW